MTSMTPRSKILHPSYSTLTKILRDPHCLRDQILLYQSHRVPIPMVKSQGIENLCIHVTQLAPSPSNILL